MISGPDRVLRVTLTLLLGLALGACGAKQVVVQGNFPSPLMERTPLTLGVVYTERFKTHEIFDEAAGREETDWLVKTGSAQVEFWDTLFTGMFTQVVHIDSHDALHAVEGEVDAVIIPYVEDLQYTIPLHTNIKVYEIWMKYRFRLVTIDAIHDHGNGELTYDPNQSLADWTLSAYGKTPTAFLQSDEEAVNLAAVVALRDAGANFATSFHRVPAVAEWLDTRNTITELPAPVPDSVGESSTVEESSTNEGSSTIEGPSTVDESTADDAGTTST